METVSAVRLNRERMQVERASWYSTDLSGSALKRVWTLLGAVGAELRGKQQDQLIRLPCWWLPT